MPDQDRNVRKSISETKYTNKSCTFQDQKKMRRDLEDETKARKSLENLVKKFMKTHQVPAVSKEKEMEESHT